MLIFGYLFLIPSTLALNILLSSSNSWVSKNIRHLQYELELQNHKVILVAPLYNRCLGNADCSARSDIRAETSEFDGGEYGHLLKSHQAYYKNLKAAAADVVRGAKGVILNKKSYTPFETSDNSYQGKDFGQDPLNLNAWFVNNSPTNTLLIALDIILPKFYPDFQPDLIILGPDEGVSFTDLVPYSKRIMGDSINPHEEMVRLAMIKNIATVCIGTEDKHNVYYQDEKVFDVTQQIFPSSDSDDTVEVELSTKNNRFVQNIKFINSKVVELIGTLSEKKDLNKTDALLPNQTSLNINFPSMNHDYSRCLTSRMNKDLNPKFNQIIYDEEESSMDYFKIPLFVMASNGELVLEGEYTIDISTNLKLMREDPVDETYIDTASLYFKHRVKAYKDETPPQDYSDNEDFRKLVLRNDLERLALRDCLISVTVNNLEFNGLGKEYFDLGN